MLGVRPVTIPVNVALSICAAFVRTKSSADSISMPAGLSGLEAVATLRSGLPVLKIRPPNAGVASINAVPTTTIQKIAFCEGDNPKSVPMPLSRSFTTDPFSGAGNNLYATNIPMTCFYRNYKDLGKLLPVDLRQGVRIADRCLSKGRRCDEIVAAQSMAAHVEGRATAGAQ